MKIKYFCFAFFLATLTSCEDWLDKQMVTSLDDEIVYTNYQNAMYAATSCYAYLPNGFFAIGSGTNSAMLASATDEAEFAQQSNAVHRMNNGAWMATDLPENPLFNNYQNIRKIYDFLDNVNRIDFDDIRKNPSQHGVYEERLENIKNMKQELKLLRAFYLFDLVKRFGGVPIFDHKTSLNDDYANTPRSSLQACVDTIVKICDTAADSLPITRTKEELGRLTSGVAKALKSEVLLFAASDLWNDPSWAGSYSHPELISLPTGDRAQRWKAAADAAKAVIDMEGKAKYRLDSYSSLFGENGFRSNEIIFCRRNGADNNFERNNLPISYDNVTGGNCPTQNLVDAFQVKEGNKARDFDWSNAKDAANPFANRDPRLRTFIVLNNTFFKQRNVEAWTGGRDGDGVRNATPTGYYLKKYVNPNSDLTKDEKTVHTWIYYRLAGIYLNYIEALNEYDPGNADIKKYYDKIRNRNGVKMPGLPSGLSQAEVRKLIRQERQVELCFEGQRMFDIRRWMDKEALSEPIRALRITKNGNSFTYSPYVLGQRVFSDKMYFYPIPQADINKDQALIQNPLW